MTTSELSYGSLYRKQTKELKTTKDEFFSDKSSTFDRVKEKTMLSVSDNNTSSFNSAADSGNSLATVIEKKVTAHSEADLTKVHHHHHGSHSKKKHAKKRGSSANSISSISKSGGSTSRSRSNASRTITISSQNCSSHSCSYSSSSSPCSGSFSSSYTSSSSSSTTSLSSKSSSSKVMTESQEIICSLSNEKSTAQDQEQEMIEKPQYTDPNTNDVVMAINTEGSSDPQKSQNEGGSEKPPPQNNDDNSEDGKPIESELYSCCACCKCCSSHYPPEIVVLVSPGSFNPVTMMHMRMLELARDAVERTWEVDTLRDGKLVRRSSLHRHPKRTKDTDPEDQYPVILPRRQIVMAGIFSPVSDGYKKAGLEQATSRRRLLRLACASSSDWLAVDDWESTREEWTPTREVLEHFQERIDRITMDIWKRFMKKKNAGTEPMDEDTHMHSSNGMPGMATDKWITGKLESAIEKYFNKVKDLPSDGKTECNCFFKKTSEMKESSTNPKETVSERLAEECPKVRVKLVGGGDLLESMGRPGLWKPEDIEKLLVDFGLICICRLDSDAIGFMKTPEMAKYEQHVIFATELCQNGLSATVVRRALAKGLSVRYLVPDAALEEIYATGLYGAKNRDLMDLPDMEELSKILNSENPNTSDNPKDVNDLFVQSIDLSSSRRKKEILLKTSSGSNICIPLTIQIGSMKDLTSGRVHLVSKSVQTKLTALPHQQAPLVLTRVPNENEKILPFDAFTSLQTEETKSIGEDLDENSLLKHVNPKTQHHVSAILPLVRQCHKCGSQKVRLILVERPQFPIVSQGLDSEIGPRVDIKYNEQQSAPSMQQASIQTDQIPLKKCSNKKTQYPSISSKQRQTLTTELKIDVDKANSTRNEQNIAPEEVPIQMEEIPKDLKSRRPPPPIPVRSPEKILTPLADPEKPGKFAQNQSFEDSEKEAPKQETLDNLISPSSIYALISDQRNRDKCENVAMITDQLSNFASIDSPNQLDDLYIPITSGQRIPSEPEKQKLCKHKRHHFHAKRENTIQSSDLNESRNISSHEKEHYMERNENFVDGKPKIVERCSKHRDAHKIHSNKSSRPHSHQRSQPSLEEVMIKELELRQSRTLPKNSRSQFIPMEDVASTQSTLRKILDGPLLAQGRGRSMPSVSSRNKEPIPRNELASRQTTLTDDSLTELLKEFDDNELLKSLETPRKDAGSHHHHSSSHTHHHHRRHQCRKGHQIMNSDEENDLAMGENNSAYYRNKAFKSQQKLLDTVMKGYSSSGKHNMDCHRNPETGSNRGYKKASQKTPKINSATQWTSPKMPLGKEPSLPGVDSDFSFFSERDNPYLSKYSEANTHRKRTTDKNSFQNMMTPEDLASHKCSRHQTQHRHSKKSSRKQQEDYNALLSNATAEEILRRQLKAKTSQSSRLSKKSSSSRTKM